MTNSVTIFAVLFCLSFTLTGCVTHREFYGGGKNLNGGLELIPAGSHLKMRVSSSGKTTSGGRYIVFSLPNQNSGVVLFYPPLRSDEWLRAEIGTKRTYAWRIKSAETNSVAHEVLNASNQTGAWLINGKQLLSSRLTSGMPPPNPIVANWKRLHGQAEIGWANSVEFRFGVDLSTGDGATVLQGQFVSYKEIWRPLALPAMLIFGENLGSKTYSPSQRSDTPNIRKPANIEITVTRNINDSRTYMVPEGTTIVKAIEIAGNLHNLSLSNNIHVIRSRNGQEETWKLNLSNPMTGGFFLIQGDKLNVQD